MEDENVVTKVLNNGASGYDIVAYRTSGVLNYEEAVQGKTNVLLETDRMEDMLSPEGYVMQEGQEPSFHKYRFEAYEDDLLVDKIVFVCRFR